MPVIRVLLVLAVGLAIGWVLRDDRVVHEQAIAIDTDRPTATPCQGACPTSAFVKGRRVSERIWGPACGDRVKIKSGSLPPGQTGEASYAYRSGEPLDPSHYGTCAITVAHLSHGRLLTTRQRCAVVVHEWGHLTGHAHVRNPQSIMNARLSAENVPDACK